MRRSHSSEKYIELAKKKFGEKFVYGNTDYTGRRNDVIITCRQHGDFKVSALTFLRSSYGCKSCSLDDERVKFIERSKAVHGDKYSYHLVEYVNTTTKVEVICSKHGPFMTEPWLHYGRGVGCMGCFQDNNRLTQDEFIAKSKVIHGDNYDYTEVEYKTHCIPVTIRCPSHGSFVQEPRVHLGGSGCSHCFLERNRSNTDRFVQQSKEIHGERYSYAHVVYRTSKEKVEIVCPKHGPFWVRPNSHLTGPAGCPRCKESKGETRVRTFLEKHGIEYIQEFKITPHRFRYDFYIPAHTLLVEFHGQQHYRPVEHFGGVSYFNETVKNDKVKIRIAKDNGYRLTILDFHKLKDDRIERFLERKLRYVGHVFDESKTITGNRGPRLMVTSD